MVKTTLGSWYVGNGVGADVNRFTIYQATGDRFIIDSSGNAMFGTTNNAELTQNSDLGVVLNGSDNGRITCNY